MIDIPFSENYFSNLEKRKGNEFGYEPCIICGKGIKESTVKYRVHVWQGVYLITTEELNSKSEEKKQSSYMNTFPIGNDCKRKHPELNKYILIDK